MTNTAAPQNLTALQTALVEDLERKYGTEDATNAVVAYSQAIAIGHTQDSALIVMSQHSTIYASAFMGALEDASL
jgi:hypothetical protein